MIHNIQLCVSENLVHVFIIAISFIYNNTIFKNTISVSYNNVTSAAAYRRTLIIIIIVIGITVTITIITDIIIMDVSFPTPPAIGMCVVYTYTLYTTYTLTCMYIGDVTYILLIYMIDQVHCNMYALHVVSNVYCIKYCI